MRRKWKEGQDHVQPVWSAGCFQQCRRGCAEGGIPPSGEGLDPDLHAGDARAEQRFKQISLAYETLGKPEARATYDAERAAARRRARRDLRAVATTMSASFVLTVGWGYFAAKWWLGV